MEGESVIQEQVSALNATKMQRATGRGTEMIQTAGEELLPTADAIHSELLTVLFTQNTKLIHLFFL